MKLTQYVTYSETLRILTNEALEKMYSGAEPAATAWQASVAQIEALLAERVK